MTRENKDVDVQHYLSRGETLSPQNLGCVPRYVFIFTLIEGPMIRS